VSSEIRMTTTILIVLRTFLEDVEQPRYGMELMRTTGLASGTLYQALARLEREGWLVSAKEKIDPVAEGRPPRRYFKLHPAMIGQARVALAEAYERLHVQRTPLGERRPGIAGA
jgi:PadR family transcriptional regulator, regulatory protein PadR